MEGLDDDTLWVLLLQLPVVDAWKCSAVCRVWNEILTSERFWKSYCIYRGWKWEKYLAHCEKREKKRERKEAARGFRRQRTYFALTTEPSFRLFSRGRFLKQEKARMLRQCKPAALTAWKDKQMRRAHFADVEGFLDFVLQLDPFFGPALNKRALIRLDQGMFEEAIVDLEKCYALFPFFTDAINNLGLACHEMNQLQKALFFYKKALLLDGDAVTFNNYGLCLNDMQRHNEAIASFSVILNHLNPNDVDALNNRGFTLNCVGKFEEAIADCTKALNLKPHLAEPRRIRAYSNYNLGRFVDAIADSTAAIEQFGSFYAKAYYTRGLARVALGRENGSTELVSLGNEDISQALHECPDVASDL